MKVSSSGPFSLVSLWQSHTQEVLFDRDCESLRLLISNQFQHFGNGYRGALIGRAVGDQLHIRLPALGESSPPARHVRMRVSFVPLGGRCNALLTVNYSPLYRCIYSLNFITAVGIVVAALIVFVVQFIANGFDGISTAGWALALGGVPFFSLVAFLISNSIPPLPYRQYVDSFVGVVEDASTSFRSSS